MDKNRNYSMVCGEITVFLSMILLLVLSLMGTTLESARVNVGRSYASRSLQNGMDSLFTEYCLPLWEEYHVFFLEGQESEEQDMDYIRNTLYEYMKDTFYPDEVTAVTENKEAAFLSQALNLGVSEMDLLEMEIQNLRVTDIVRADDYNGELFFHQILEYSKYQAGEEFLASEKEMVKSLEEVNASVTVAQKQLEAEQKMAEVNLEVLEFISAVEGISTGKTGIQYKWNGRIKTEEHFVKKFCTSAITMGNVGINHETVWKSLKNSYCNPVQLIGKLEREARKVLSQIKKAEAQEEAGEEVDEVNYEKLSKREEEFLEEAEGIFEKIGEAEVLLDEIRDKQSVFAKEAEAFEMVYKEEEAKLSGESRKAFQKELEKLKSFAGMESNDDTSVIAKVLSMEPYLEANREVLEEVLVIKHLFIGSTAEEAEAYIEELGNIKEIIEKYQIQQMKFDYSSLIIEKDMGNPLEAFSKGYKNGLLELVIKDASQISQKAKKSQVRVLESKSMNAKDQTFFADSLKESAKEGYTGEIGEGLEQFVDFYDSEGFLESSVDEQFQKILLSSYVEEHFKSYGDAFTTEAEDKRNNTLAAGQNKEVDALEVEMEKEEVKETVLDYEEEYLLAGNLSDRENLSETVSRIVFARSILNYVYLLTDSEKTETAYYTAAALVGYTCMEPLVQLTKNLILLVWAAEEAMVDAGALLQGKEVPVFKTKETFQISFEELLSFNRTLIQKKVQGMPQSMEGAAMNYQEYLRLFLTFSQKVRKLNGMMELIEDNIKLRYDKDFRFSSCIYGISAKGQFFMKEKFLSLPFVQQILPNNGEGFLINSQQSYCY